MYRCAASIVSLALVAGCGTPEVAAPRGLRVTVAPLTLPDVDEVTYGLRVLSASGTVWAETGLLSSRFGDGHGGLTYIGTCDAGANPHTVELTIEKVRAGGRDLMDPRDWINPAPVGRPIRKTQVTCVENQDVLVAFDLTVLRSAGQGFFDVGVAFDDIFCSAKLDCHEALLHNPRTGRRDATVVVALACTGGEREATYVHLSDLVLSCDDTDPLTAPVTFTMPAAGMAPGQHGALGGDDGTLAAGIFETAVYQGDEAITSDGRPLDKCFWNRAFGLDRGVLAGRSCRLRGLGTATDADLASPLDLAALSAAGAYPFIRWDVEVLTAGGQLCAPHPLNGTPIGVTTEYATPETAFAALAPLGAEVTCGSAPVAVGCPAPSGSTIVITEVGDGVVSVVAGEDSATVALPEGYELGTTCCADGCCSTPMP